MFWMSIKNNDDRLKVERLYFEYRKLMYKEAYDILQDRFLAEDAIHESFIRIINNLHKIDEINRPSTRSFLVIICRNVAKDIYKSKSKLNKVSDIEEYFSTEASNISSNPPDIVITRETLSKISEAIEKLNPIYRDVFLMRRVYGFSREEIANIFGISVETVKKRLVRAKVKIVEYIGEEELKSGK